MVGFRLMEEAAATTKAVAVAVEEKGENVQLNWIPNLLNRKIGAPLGLRNQGNSCYLNSVLQCLTYTPPLANFCLRQNHSPFCDLISDPNRKRDCPFCLLEKRIARSLSTDLTLDAPAKIFSCLRIFSENFKSGRQEDAHEFLRYVIDACHSTCLRLKKLQQQVPKKSSNGIGGESLGSNTIVNDIFGGALQSQVKCLSCGNESNKVDEIMDICLEISGCSSLKDAMKNFFQAEILDGNNKYKCERCKKLVTAKKQMSVLQAPNVLVVQLKRFEGMFGRKIDRAIAFEDIFYLSSFMCKASQDPHPEYSLFATIVHSGFSPDSGHYYAYIKNAIGRWYCCNDSYVTSANLQEVLTEKAYILFFTRTSQRPVAADTASVSNGVKSNATATVFNRVKSNAIATVSNGVTSNPVATLSKEMKLNATAVVPNGVKSLVSNGKTMCGSPKSTTPVKAVYINSANAPCGKVVPAASKVNDAPKTTLQNKFNGFGNSFAKKDSPSDNGTVHIWKKESEECNGNISHVASEHMNGNGISLVTHDNGNYINRNQNAIESTKELVNGNGHIQNGYDDSEKGLHKDNSLRDGEIVGKMSINGTIHNGLRNERVNISGTKRKLEDKESSFLLERDAQSRTQVDNFKEVLQKEASLVLQSCGWSDRLYKYMTSRKRLCIDTCTSTDTNEQKKALIADAKTSFIAQIPGSLKESLIEHIRSFSRGK